MEYPIISCYPHHANLVANVMTNDFDFDELSTNYIQVVYNQNINRSDFNYGIDILSYIKNYPYVDSYCYDRNVVKEKWKTYDSFVVDMIDKGCYVHMLIDTFYISAYSSWYKTSHKVHNITIYGYDETYFYVADNFKNGKYSFEKINRTEIDAAELDGEEYDWLDGVHCWRLKENVYLCIGIDTTMVKKMINEYLNHKKTGAFTKLEENRRGIYGRPFYYGIDVYDKIIDYVRNEENI